MLTRLHDQLGTAGLVVAVIALVAALSGAAFAASGGLTAKQKKEVKKIAKSFQGAGPTGATGVPGKDGSNGVNGTNGADGADGKSVLSGEEPAGPKCLDGGYWFQIEGSPAKSYVCNGAGASGAKTVLGTGETETGLWSYAAKDVTSTFMTVSFPFRVEPAPKFNWIGPSESSTSACPGSFSDPQAEPGELCLYAKEAVSSGSGTDHHPEGLTTGSVGGQWTTDPTSGVVAEFPINAGEEGYGFGSWAVTAGS